MGVSRFVTVTITSLSAKKTPEFNKGAIEIGLQVNHDNGHGIMHGHCHSFSYHTVSESFPKKMVQISVEKEGLALLYI